MSVPQVLCAGMVVVDVLVQGFQSLPPAGETGVVSGVSLAAGGDAINQATAVAKLGSRVGLFGLIGDDMQGRLIREHCARHGIDMAGLRVDPVRTTSTGVVLIDREGERSFLAMPEATSQMYGPEHVALDAIRPGLKVLSVGSLFYAERFDREAFAPLLRKAKEAGAITVADMVMDQRSYGLDELHEAWPYLDYAVPSELEAQQFTGTTEPAAVARGFQRRGVKNVVLKRGSKGVIAFLGDRVFECPAFRVDAVDTTGAGDNFVGGFIHALVQGHEASHALRFASAVAALSIQAVGAGAGLKDLAQVAAFLATH
ncbi:MAG: hypothetical protein RLZZ200_1579 [Pseudomonadota bacterium]|jgi:sugar/nucleoside kinase (ribokinase family)